MRLLIAIAIVFTLGLSTTAYAAGGTSTLIAGPLRPSGTSRALHCNVVNVSAKEVTVVVELLDETGAIVDSQVRNLSAGTGRTIWSWDSWMNGFGWCRFTVQGKASAVRATASIWESGLGEISAVAAY